MQTALRQIPVSLLVSSFMGIAVLGSCGPAITGRTQTVPVNPGGAEEVATVSPHDPDIIRGGEIHRYEGGCPELDRYSYLTGFDIMEPGSQISFSFKGSEVLIYDILGPEGVILETVLDDGPATELCRFDRFSGYRRLGCGYLVKGADAGKVHTLTLKVTDKDFDKRAMLDEEARAIYDSTPGLFSSKHYYAGKIMILGELVRHQPETLYNGITISGVWPPRYALPSERHSMPLSYIENPPEVIVAKTGRQLFVDDFLIDWTDMKRVTHQARMYEGNPVIAPDKPWEYRKNGTYMTMTFSGGLFFDEKDGRFKAWYNSGDYCKDGVSVPCYCYAESHDGKHWEKPGLDVIPGTNIIDTVAHDSQAVWLDKFEKDPDRRFKSVYVVTRDSCMYDLKYSPDGVHWSGTVAESGGRIQDRSTVMYNPFRKKWIASLRIVSMKKENLRSRGYMEDDDLERLVSRAHWVQDEIDYVRDSNVFDYTMKDKDIVYWFSSDDMDYPHPDTAITKCTPAIYNFDAIAYESVMLGQYAVWRGPENHICNSKHVQKLNEFCLGFSRDGFHYFRPDHRPVMVTDQKEGAWNWGNMQAAIGNPIIVGDSLYFYCSGRMRNDNDWDGCATTGLGIMRRDGFVSMDAVGPGSLLTRPLSFEGDYFFVNAGAASLSVEILDKDCNPIKGFTREDCIPLKSFDGTKVQVTWKGRRQLKSLSGKPVRIRFYITDGQLYSFWVSPWKTGESRGYLGGGGPGLNPSGIDEPFCVE